MDRNDQQAIEDLFRKLATVEDNSPARDPEAETFIREQITRHPGAPYYMAQTIIVQEQALEAAQARIEELEGPAKEGTGGGLFNNIFGGSTRPTRSTSVPRVGRAGAAPEQMAKRQGAAFLPGLRRRRWAWPAAFFSAMRSPACLAAATKRKPRIRTQVRRIRPATSRNSTTPTTIPAASMMAVSMAASTSDP